MLRMRTFLSVPLKLSSQSDAKHLPKRRIVNLRDFAVDEARVGRPQAIEDLMA